MAYKLQWEGNKVIEDIVEDGVIPGILEASIWLQGELKKKISKPGKGRIYTKRIFGGSVRRYRASAPGDPPTVFEGNLRRSIQIDKSKLKGLKRESMFIQLLEGLSAEEAELLCLIKDGKLTSNYKRITKAVVSEAFPQIEWGNRGG